jgi:hypothetical protein
MEPLTFSLHVAVLVLVQRALAVADDRLDLQAPTACVAVACGASLWTMVGTTMAAPTETSARVVAARARVVSVAPKSDVVIFMIFPSSVKVRT